jgi:hypothetical protein
MTSNRYRPSCLWWFLSAISAGSERECVYRVLIHPLPLISSLASRPSHYTVLVNGAGMSIDEYVSICLTLGIVWSLSVSGFNN